MIREFLPVALVAAISGGVVIAGATYISLTGSDPTPQEEKFQPFCFTDLQIDAPLSNQGQGNDYKVREVVVSGNFLSCEGHTLLLSAKMNSSQTSYAFHKLRSTDSEFTLRFDAGQGAGDWRHKYPRIVDHQLEPDGPYTPPSSKLTPSDIKWVISDSW